MNSYEKEKETRKKANEELLRKMKSGESLKMVSVQSTWFPPRPIIKKNEDKIKELYGDNASIVGVTDENNENNENNETGEKKDKPSLRLVGIDSDEM
jgi:hypothetical protein